MRRRRSGARAALGVLLPCNVIVYEKEGRTRVAAVEPQELLSVVGNEELSGIAWQVREDFERIVGELTGK